MEIIEKNRVELMGVATLSIIVAHLIHRFGDYGTGDYVPCIMLYTYGFLFLSGYSIAYSLSRKSDLLLFYKNRAKNTIVPFFIASFIPITIMSVIDNVSVIIWIVRLSSFNFFIEGNVCGTWYIAVIILLYLISPLLNYLGKSTIYMFILLSATMIATKWLSPSLYNYEHAFTFQIPAYFAGFACYYCNNKISFYTIISELFCVGVLASELQYIEMGISFIMLIVWGHFFSFCKKAKNKFIVWCGENSIILYLIHLEVCFLFQRIGFNPKVSIIIGIVTAVIACKYIRIIITKTNKFIFAISE